MTSNGHSAQDIYQDFLDIMDTHVEADDFDAFAARVVLPHIIRTGAETLSVDTSPALRAAFDDMRKRMTLRNVTRRTRHCIAARFTDVDNIEGSHTTWLVTDGTTLLESYQVSNALRNVGGLWCVVGTSYSGRRDTLPAHMADAIASFHGYAK